MVRTKIFTFFLCIWLLFSLMGCNFVKLYYKLEINQLERHGFKELFIQDSISTIHTLSKTTGKPVIVLLHGFSGDGVNQWFQTAKRLSHNFDVIIPDLYYHGLSSSKNPNISLYDQVALLDTVLKSIGIDSNINLVGNSYGGIVASLYSRENNEKVDKLFLYDSPVMFYSLSLADSIAKTLGTSGIEDLLCPIKASTLKISLRAVYYTPPPIPVFLRKQMISTTVIPNRESRIKLLNQLGSEALKNISLDRNEMPEIYLLWGQYDLFIPLSVCDSLKNYWELDENHIYIFPNAAHVANVEYPRKFSKVLTALIRAR